MRSTPSSGANELPKTQCPSVLKIAKDEFQQSFAVAQLAVKLWEIKIAKLNLSSLEKQKLRDNPDLAQCLGEAWELIQKAHEHVSRPLSNAKYLQSGIDEAAEVVVGRILQESRVPFQKLCNDKEAYTEIELRDADTADTKTIIKIEWKVYRSERGFNDLFWSYWNATSVIKDEDKRKDYGQSLLASWKLAGVPGNTFLALARFRRKRDKRAANLKTKPKRKRRQQLKVR